MNNENNKKTNQNIEPEEKKVVAAPAPAPEVDDDIASAEEVAAEARRQAERRAQRKNSTSDVKASDGDDEWKESGARPEDLTDPYAEPDPTLPWVKYEHNNYVMRGCNHCPESYKPVSTWERNSCSKLSTYNWMANIRRPAEDQFNVVEVRFKNNRKDYFRLPEGLSVVEGDVVAVEGMPGHDVGIVSLTGEVCRVRMKNRQIDPDGENIKKLYRRAKATDIEKWAEAISEEPAAVLKTRKIAENLGLEMKVNDVEMQGDRSKAIFYYTADDRVDFRQLIKVLAETFRVRVEMKQIGVRQEAGKVGGLGTCGRELCCCTWLTNFKTVSTNAAKMQQILPNPQKLAGQCGKLKCCLNFELEVYADAMKKFPPANVSLRFKKGLAMYKKSDVFRGVMWYAYEGENDLHAIPAESVKKIIEMNREQKYPEQLEDYQVELMTTSALAQETSDAEFERELRRMAEGGNGVVEEEKPDQRKPQNNDRPRRDNQRDGGQQNNRRPNNRQGNGGNRNNNNSNGGGNRPNNQNRNRQGGGNRNNEHKNNTNNSQK